MRGLGTIINVACILAGGLAGLLFGKKIKPQMQETLLYSTGVAVLFLGAGGAMEKMLSIQDGALASGGTMMMIISLALGAVIGELLRIDHGVEYLGEWLKVKSGSGGDNRFVSGFVNASCTVCIGAMAIVGSIQDGIYGDFSTLLAKGILDAIIICIMAASQGKGCIFSAVPVALFQGGVTAIAAAVGDFMPPEALDRLSFVGAILIFCVGLNMIREKKLRVANLLPALVIAAMWGSF